MTPKVEPPKDEITPRLKLAKILYDYRDEKVDYIRTSEAVEALIKLQQEALLLGVIEILDRYNVPNEMARKEKMSPDDLTRLTSVIANHDDLIDDHNMKKALRDYTHEQFNKLRLEL